MRHFAYSARLRDHINARSEHALSETDIRESSAQVVTPDDVKAVDTAMSEEIMQVREAGGHLLIDSHPVTKERYGFRVTPFAAEDLEKLAIDTLVCLYAAPAVLARRIEQDPQGRPLPTEFELLTHVQLQAAVVAQYAVLAGRHCYLVDTDRGRQELAQEVVRLLKLSDV